MIKKTYMNCLLLTLTFVSTNVLAQSDEADIKHTINSMFDGMRKTDTTLIRAAFSAVPILQTVVKNKEGNIIILTESLDSFLISVSKPHTEIYDERISFELVKIDAELAIAWTPYKFYVGDNFSHCGVDSYQLVKIDGQWKIQYLVDTRRRQECK